MERVVRSAVVKQMAKLYIDSHLSELVAKVSVVKLLSPRRTNLREQFSEHIDMKVDADFPLSDHGTSEGCIPAVLKTSITEAAEKNVTESAYDHKQTTGHDLPTSSYAESLSDLRPSSVVAEASTQDAFDEEVP